MFELTPWDTRFCFDIALGIDSTEEVLKRYGVDPATYEEWCNNPVFTRTISELQRYIRDNGLSFKAKARIQAEDLLDVAYKLTYSPDTPANVRADLIKWIAKMGELEPKSTERQQKEEPLFTDKMMHEMLEKMSDGELELRVLQVLGRRNNVKVITQDE